MGLGIGWVWVMIRIVVIMFDVVLMDLKDKVYFVRVDGYMV